MSVVAVVAGEPSVAGTGQHASVFAVEVLRVLEVSDLFIGEQRIHPDALEDRLRTALKADADAQIVIKAEEDVRHAEVVRLLDLVRDVGFPGVSIGTQLKTPGVSE